MPSVIEAALVARGTFVLCEYDASTGHNEDLTEISRKVLPKIPRTGAIRSYVYAGHTFNYLLEKDLIFLCIATTSSGSEVVFQFLNEFRRSFESQRRTNGNKEAELTRMLRDLITKYNSEKGKMRCVEEDLEDVTDLMRDNLTKVMERGERIESLIDKTDQLKFESSSFRKNAKRYNDDLWWRDQRGRILLGICILVIISFISWWMLGNRTKAADAA
eukprot:TRINITY_DN37878_c0_g1_i1.p1 TRINITY_DN37878_c0_g1~~TRINITY_DN37878_c0_g1_i1.p1  ORF type:complete len:217 (-),score=25.04 TRINITY_DN37878_c0_g1_i1:86-736(-)